MSVASLTPAAGVQAAEEVADRASRPVPQRLVDGEGRPNLGAFRGVIGTLNSRELGAPYPRFAGRWLLEKRWCNITVASPEAALVLAVLDLKYLASAFCYVLDRTENRLHELSRLTPLGAGLRFEGGPLSGAVHLTAPGVRIDIEHRCAAGERTVRLHSRTYRGAVDLTLRIADDARATTPISSVQGFAPHGLIYSHRSGPLAARGQVVLDGRARRFAEGESFATFHWLWAIHPRDARWTWVGAAGRSSDGSRVLGFNLTRGSDRLGEPENFLWFDGDPVAVGRVSFAMDLARKDGEWAIRSEDGRVRLSFQPDVVRIGRRDAIWARAYFRQPIGRFSGTLVDASGRTVEVRELLGFAADQTVHW